MAGIITRLRVWTVGAALLLLPRLATAEIACVGDCDDGGAVTINELITGVNIALGTQALGFCPLFDANADGMVGINELIAGVNNALNGCPTPGTPTATTTGAASATATATPVGSATVTATATASATRTGTATATPPVSPTATVPPTATATSTRTATSAMTPTPTRTATRTSTPSVTPAPTSQLHQYDRILESPLEIYDNDPYGVFDDLHLTDTAVIDELAVYLDIPHTWVGDLVVTLTHWNTGSEVLLLYPPVECGGDNVLALLNDDAAVKCDSLCSAVPPAIGDECSPTQPLSSFAGESLAGTWSLAVADVDATETGALAAWSLRAIAHPPPTPGGPSAPDVLVFTCNDFHLCWVVFTDDFELAFTFADADGDADGWRIWAVSEDDEETFIDARPIDPPSGGDTIVRFHTGIKCDPCPLTYYFDIYVAVRDSSGRESAPARVRVVAYAPYLVTGAPDPAVKVAPLDR